MEKPDFDWVDNMEENICDLENLVINKLGEHVSYVKDLKKRSTLGSNDAVVNVNTDIQTYLTELCDELEKSLNTLAQIREWAFIIQKT